MYYGREFLDTNGDKLTVIAGFSENDLVVQYDDGEVISGVNLSDLENGSFTRDEENTVDEYQKKPGVKTTIREERDRTFQNVRYLLEKYHKCVMIRPCSFGKTVIGKRLFKLPEYKKCLFLHPNKDEANSSKIKNIPGKVIDVKTYDWLARRTDEQIKKLKYDIVFMDEVHCCGGEERGENRTVGAYQRYLAAQKMMMWNPNIHFVGATATPYRMDGIDVIQKLFLGHTCYPYTNDDAFEDGLLKKPYYLYCTYHIYEHLKKDIEKKAKNVLHEMTRDEVSKILKSEKLEQVDAENMDKHIRRSCDKYLDDTSYMRFIAFYLTIDEIKENKKKVVDWFKKAYPDHKIETIEVHSRSNTDMKKVDNLPVEPNKIDIIFNCEKLCMGYHSEHITGLIMERKTQSMTKYIQMVGRLLSCDSDKPVIIFDIVDNFHTPFIVKRQPMDLPTVGTVKIEDTNPNFAALRKAHPYATDWEAVARAASKMREQNAHKKDDTKETDSDCNNDVVSKAIDTAATFDTSNVSTDFGLDAANTVDNNAQGHNYEVKAESAPVMSKLDFIKKAAEVIKEKNLSFQESMSVYQKAQSDYKEYAKKIRHTPETATRLAPPESLSYYGVANVSVENTTDKDNPSVDSGSSSNGLIADGKSASNYTKADSETISPEVETEKTKTITAKTDDVSVPSEYNSSPDDEELGYSQNRYAYDYRTGSLWDTNHVNMITNELDPDELVDMLLSKPRQAIINSALSEFNRVMRENNLKPDFSDIKNINKKSFEFLTLSGAAELFGASVDDLLNEYNKAS